MPEKSSRFKTLMAVIGSSKGEFEEGAVLPSTQDSLPPDPVEQPPSSVETVVDSELNSIPDVTPSSTSDTVPEIIWVEHSKIHRDPGQSRRYFDPDDLEKMAKSMKAVGIIDPLSIRLRPDSDEYDLLAGEKRHRSAEIAGITTVPCRVFEVDDAAADDIKAISNLQRGDLNKWEETNAIMGMLCRNLQKSQEEVVSILNRASNQRRGLTDNVVRNEDWVIIEEVFDLVGRLTPESFRKHRVPLLKLPDPIQEVLQQGRLSYTKVNEILKVKDPVQQKKLLDEAIVQNLSVDAIQRRVKTIRQAGKQDTPSSLVSRLMALAQAAKKQRGWPEPEKSARLEILLREMEGLLN